MATKIYAGDTYLNDIEVTMDYDGEQVPFDLTDYDDVVYAVKDSRETPDEDAYIFEAGAVVGDPRDGIIRIHIPPIHTRYLPTTTGYNDSLYLFVQIASSITGVVREVYASKAKIIQGGIGRIIYADRSLDMGMLEETVGWVFDMGDLCDTTLQVIDLDILEDPPYFDGGTLGEATELIVDCLWLEDDPTTELLDLGTLEPFCSISSW